jgi:hypothetical protein
MPDDDNQAVNPPVTDDSADDLPGGTSGNEGDSQGDATLGESGERAFRRTQDELRRIKAERATLAKERDEALGKVREYEAQQRTEAENLQIRLQELERQNSSLQHDLVETRLRVEVTEAAHALNFLNEGDAMRFLDRDQLQLDDDGQPKNVRALLKKVAEEKPYLVKDEGSASIPATPRGSAPPPRNAALEAARKAIRMPARI